MMKTLLTLLLLSLSQPLWAAEFNLYLLRHAEKQDDGSKDPSLTDVGRQQGQRLARLLQHAGIQRIYSTDYRRTRETVAALSELTGKEVQLYDPSDLNTFARTLQQRGENAVIVGHSNTTPQLIGILGGKAEAMSESDYGDLYQLQIHPSSVTTVHLSL
jgi:phosphohistidine phosphatase SixA